MRTLRRVAKTLRDAAPAGPRLGYGPALLIASAPASTAPSTPSPVVSPLAPSAPAGRPARRA